MCQLECDAFWLFAGFETVILSVYLFNYCTGVVTVYSSCGRYVKVHFTWRWQWPFKQIWKFFAGHEWHRSRACGAQLWGAKFENWFGIRAPSTSPAELVVSSCFQQMNCVTRCQEYCFSRAGQRASSPGGASLSFLSAEGQSASLLALRKWRREVYSVPPKKKKKRKKARVWCMHYLFWAGSTGSWKSST